MSVCKPLPRTRLHWICKAKVSSSLSPSQPNAACFPLASLSKTSPSSTYVAILPFSLLLIIVIITTIINFDHQFSITPCQPSPPFLDSKSLPRQSTFSSFDNPSCSFLNSYPRLEYLLAWCSIQHPAAPHRIAPCASHLPHLSFATELLSPLSTSPSPLLPHRTELDFSSRKRSSLQHESQHLNP